MAENNEEIKVALEGLEKINADKEKVRIAELREKYILDRNTEIKIAEAKGKAEGTVEGKKEEKLEIAKKMKEENISLEVIMKVTELSKEEIEKL